MRRIARGLAQPSRGDLDVKDDAGKMVTWGFENAGVSQLAQEGYNRNTLKIGQQITAVVNPAAGGAPTAIAVKVILADGSEIMSRERGQNRSISSLSDCWWEIGNMRSRFTILTTVLSVIFALSIGIANAQGGRGGNAQGGKDFKTKYESNTVTKEFDPHDFSGIWEMTRNDHTMGAPAPPLTPRGVAAMAGRVADKGAVIGNAPWYTCNPMGFPRLLNDDEPMEFIMTKDKVIQVFQWEHRIRYLWTDGRELPSGQDLENLGPAWYGHSVANWDGNTLVVNTVGLEERAWLDNAGLPKSFHARIEETWKRTDYNTLELQLTLHDPEYYTAPYVGGKKIFKRIPDEDTTYFGWKGLFAGISEGICAPINEVEGYNKGFRDVGHPNK